MVLPPASTALRDIFALRDDPYLPPKLGPITPRYGPIWPDLFGWTPMRPGLPEFGRVHPCRFVSAYCRRAMDELLRPLWHLDAPCFGHLEAFYPDDLAGPLRYAAAALICAGCRHVDACRAEGDAIEAGVGAHSIHGFRAGESPKARRRRRAGVRPADAVPVAALTL